jgi:hypothetical protein
LFLQARKKEERAAAAPQVDPAESSRLEREKAEEADIIGRTCRELGVELHEVSMPFIDVPEIDMCR